MYFLYKLVSKLVDFSAISVKKQSMRLKIKVIHCGSGTLVGGFAFRESDVSCEKTVHKPGLLMHALYLRDFYLFFFFVIK